MSIAEEKAKAWEALRDHFKDFNDRIMFGIDGAENMGLLADCIPCEFVDMGAGRDFVGYAMIMDGPDGARQVSILTEDEFCALQARQGGIVMVDPFSAEMLKRMGQPIEPKVVKDHGRPWVDMKRKPWERKR